MKTATLTDDDVARLALKLPESPTPFSDLVSAIRANDHGMPESAAIAIAHRVVNRKMLVTYDRLVDADIGGRRVRTILSHWRRR